MLKNTFSKKALISYLQIVILIISTFAFAFIIYSATNAKLASAEEESEDDTLTLDDLENSDTSLADIGFQSAANSFTLACCAQRNDGAKCQETLSSQCDSSCSSNCVPSRCEQVSGCELGCCFDNSRGSCAANTPKSTCEANGGTWSNDAACTNAKCERNCCILNGEVRFVTDKECELLSASKGITKNIKRVNSENECLFFANLQERGACIIGNSNNNKENACKIITKEQCISSRGNFFSGYLCSNPELETSCEKQKKTECSKRSGEDGVYWYDSCGNRENIFMGEDSAGKARSFNDGKIILFPSSSCNPDKSNVGSETCGNCNRFLGSTCGVNNQGDARCKSLDCKDAPASGNTKEDRKNGESWCVYESAVGDGKDIPGSRHYVYSCVDGEVISEPCADYRSGICTEEGLETPRGEINVARCRPNMAHMCIYYNSVEKIGDDGKKKSNKEIMDEIEEKCDENPDCYFNVFNFGKKYKFGVCLPQYPKGFTLSEANSELEESICNGASFTCTKVEVKSATGSWKCKAGCDCDKKEYTESMNEWCSALGDCGASVNVEGRLTTGGAVSVKKTKALTNEYLRILQGYASDSEIEKQSIESEDVSKFGSAFEENLCEDGDEECISSAPGAADSGAGSSSMQSMMMGIGAIGALAGVGEMASLDLGNVVAAVYGSPSTPAVSVLSAISGAAIGASLGAVVGQLISKQLGIQGLGATITIALSSIAGALTGLAIVGAFGVAVPLVGWAIAIILIGVVKMIGMGDTRITKYEFECHTWEKPDGGTDCSLCEKNPLMPCTDYRCRSLGKTCEIVNEGTSDVECVDMAPNDKKVPVITPWEKPLSEGYSYSNVEDYSFRLRESNGNCIPEMTPVTIGIVTDEYALCKMSMDSSANYDEMESSYFGGSSIYRKNHTTILYMPSASSIIYQLMNDLEDTNTSMEEENIDIELLKQRITEQYNDVNFRVRCEDKSGNSDLNEYVINTCVKPSNDETAPAISLAAPVSGSFVSYGLKETTSKFYLNEPAECRWSKTPGKIYAQMENSMNCLTRLDDAKLLGWPCEATFSNLSLGENNFYIKCLDKPWLRERTDTEEKRIANSEDYTYKLKVTQTPLNISEVKPVNGSTIFGGSNPFSVTLSAKTNGGAFSGASVCSYSFSENGTYSNMYATSSTSHKQVFDMMLAGDRSIYLKCRDNAGNEAKAKTSFKLEIDTTAPEATRAYQNGGSLYITTNENSQCIVSYKDCNFDAPASSNSSEQGIITMRGTEKTHSTPWVVGKDHFVRCTDIFGNPNIGCSIIVRGYNN